MRLGGRPFVVLGVNECFPEAHLPTAWKLCCLACSWLVAFGSRPQSRRYAHQTPFPPQHLPSVAHTQRGSRGSFALHSTFFSQLRYGEPAPSASGWCVPAGASSNLWQFQITITNLPISRLILTLSDRRSWLNCCPASSIVISKF